MLYTGPMFQVYNTVLRRAPPADFDRFRAGGNLFPTTIAALASAVAKLARAARLPPGLALYRGLGPRAELPDGFWAGDARGRRGYLEWGFLSTTGRLETAVEYAGGPAGGGSGDGGAAAPPTVLRARSGAVDRGASVRELSQYPGEVRAGPARPAPLNTQGIGGCGSAGRAVQWGTAWELSW